MIYFIRYIDCGSFIYFLNLFIRLIKNTFIVNSCKWVKCFQVITERVNLVILITKNTNPINKTTVTIP